MVSERESQEAPGAAGTPGHRRASETSDRILDAALDSFGTKGFDATSLDNVAASLDLTKQAILYWFRSKEELLGAVIDRSAAELSGALEEALAAAGTGWSRVEAVVRAIFRLAARRPELLGLVREVTRLGPPATTRLATSLHPLVSRAALFLEEEMDRGTMQRRDPRLLLLAAYSVVIGMLTEEEVLRAVGVEPTTRSLVRRRAELLDLLRSVLMVRPT